MIRKIGVLGFGLALSASALAGKVVVFDHQKAMFDTDLAQKKVQQLQDSEEIKSLTIQGQALAEDLKALQKEYETQGVTWSEETKQEKTNQGAKITAEMQQIKQNLDQIQNAALASIAEELQPKLQEVLKRMVVTQKIDMIIRKQAVYVVENITPNTDSDITAKVTAELNKEVAKAKK